MFKKGQEIKLIGSDKVYYFIGIMDDGNLELTDNPKNLYFGNKFVSEREIKN